MSRRSNLATLAALTLGISAVLLLGARAVAQNGWGARPSSNAWGQRIQSGVKNPSSGGSWGSSPGTGWGAGGCSGGSYRRGGPCSAMSPLKPLGAASDQPAPGLIWPWPWVDFPNPARDQGVLIHPTRPRVLRPLPARPPVKVAPAAPVAVRTNPPAPVTVRRNSAPDGFELADDDERTTDWDDLYESSFGTQEEADQPVEESFLDEDPPADEEFDFAADPSFEPEDDLFADVDAGPTVEPMPSETGPENSPSESVDTSVTSGDIADTSSAGGPTLNESAAADQSGGHGAGASEGEELGTTAPSADVGPSDERPVGAETGSDGRNKPQGTQESKSNGWGASPADGSGWTQSTNPGPTLNSGYEPKPYPDVFDSGRPGQQNGDWSIIPNPPFIFDKSIDPMTGQEQRNSVGGGIEWKVGGPRSRSSTKPRAPRDNEIPYFNALPPVPDLPGSPLPAPSTSSPASLDRPGQDTRPPGSSTQPSDELAPDGGSKPAASREEGLMKVEVTAGDDFTQAVNDATAAVTGVDPMQTMEGVVQGIVDGTETVVRAGVNGLKAVADWLPAAPIERPEVDAVAQQRERARVEQQRQQAEQRKAEQERNEREQRKSQARLRTAEKEWQSTEGAAFGQKHGPRPKDPEGAAKWEKERDKAIRKYLFQKELHDLQPNDRPPDGIRA